MDWCFFTQNRNNEKHIKVGNRWLVTLLNWDILISQYAVGSIFMWMPGKDLHVHVQELG